MKAATLHGYDEALTSPEFVTYEEVDDPRIEKPTDVIVRIGGAGVCRTDLHIIEGVWKGHVDVAFPHIMGHENAGWVEEVGSGVESVKVGDPVICHPLVTSGHCLACRRGNDMHAGESSFPGINAAGGYADYLHTGERALIKLPQSLAPKDVAPYTDAGLTAYRVAKKAAAPSGAGRVRRDHRRRRARPYRHPVAGGAVRGRDYRDRLFRPGARARQGMRRPPRGARG